MESREYTDEEMIEIMRGMEEANRIMVEEIYAVAPMCHFRKMDFEQSDSVDGYYTNWWECSVCGHTKDI